MMSPLAARLREKPIVVAPGVYDALTAALAAEAGFPALYLSGAAIAYTRLGRPDIGLVSMSRGRRDTIALIRDRVATPLIVDADNGYGNALNVQRTVRLFERAGASAIQLEDQTLSQALRPSATRSALIPAAEMAGKIRPPSMRGGSAETLDHRAHRCRRRRRASRRPSSAPHLYAEAGADVLFVEAPAHRGAAQGRSPPAARRRAAADGQHGRGRQDAPCPRDDLAGAGLLARHLPRRRSCARSPTRPAAFYATLRRDGTTRRVPQPDVRLPTPSMRPDRHAEMLALGKRYESFALPQNGGAA